MINGSTPSRSFDKTQIGVFVYNNHDAELLYQAGIPYWFMHPTSHLAHIRVDELEDFIYPADYDDQPDSEIIYEGSADLHAIHHAILKYNSLKAESQNPFVQSAMSVSPVLPTTRLADNPKKAKAGKHILFDLTNLNSFSAAKEPYTYLLFSKSVVSNTSTTQARNKFV